VVETASSGNSAELRKLVPDAQYRDAMLKLIRNIVPAGRAVEEVELTRVSGTAPGENVESVLLLPHTRMNVANVMDATAPKGTSEAISAEGILRALHLGHNWLEITKENGEHLRFQTKEDVLDDVVGPMVNRRVAVKGHRESRRSNILVLADIELNEKATGD
jgi:hypothetical protein